MKRAHTFTLDRISRVLARRKALTAREIQEIVESDTGLELEGRSCWNVLNYHFQKGRLAAFKDENGVVTWALPK